jgi:hypothetical protein
MKRVYFYSTIEELELAVKTRNELRFWLNGCVAKIKEIALSGYKIKNNTQLDKKTMDKLTPILKTCSSWGAWITVSDYSIILNMKVSWDLNNIAHYIEEQVYLNTEHLPSYEMLDLDDVAEEIRIYKLKREYLEQLETELYRTQIKLACAINS